MTKNTELSKRFPNVFEKLQMYREELEQLRDEARNDGLSDDHAHCQNLDQDIDQISVTILQIIMRDQAIIKNAKELIKDYQ